MSYIFSIICMFMMINEKMNGNVLDTGLLTVAAAIFWFSGNYFYKTELKKDNQNKESEDNNNGSEF